MGVKSCSVNEEHCSVASLIPQIFMPVEFDSRRRDFVPP